MRNMTAIAAALAALMSCLAISSPVHATEPAAQTSVSDEAEKPTLASFLRKRRAETSDRSNGDALPQDKTAALQGAVEKHAALPYRDIVSRHAARHGLPEALVHAVIRVESNYRPTARGRAGEVGLMQIKPATARGMGFSGSVQALYDPETNIRYGVKYLARAYQLGGGDTCGTILRYNAGHAATRMNRISANYCKKVQRIMAEA